MTQSTAQKVSNWGRWGEDDQKGMLNLLTSEHVLKSLAMVRKGRVYNLAVPLEERGPQFPEFHKTWRVTHYANDPSPDGFGIADDVVMMEAHSGTHIDSLAHAWRDGQMYNGKDWRSAVSSRGVEWGSVDTIEWIIGRGIVLDVAAAKGVEHLERGEVVTPELLDAASERQGTKVRPGDILLIHTGWHRVFFTDRAHWDTGEPGPDSSIGPWLKEKDVAVLGADTPGVEVMELPIGDGDLPVHALTLRDLGVPLLENVDLRALVEDQVFEFLFIGAPLRLANATGAGMTPLALV